MGEECVTEAKDKVMRDIRIDLQDRANWIRQQIRAEQAQFELLTTQLEKQQSDQVEGLRVQLETVTRFLQYANWHHEVHIAIARALALAATAEIAARQFYEARGRCRPPG
jgi:hypothetical protein